MTHPLPIQEEPNCGLASVGKNPMELRLPFLAARDYLHGTTLLDALLGQVPPGASTIFKINHMIPSDRVRAVPVESLNRGALSEFAAVLTWRTSDSNGVLGVEALPSSACPERRPYPEELITQHVVHLGQTAIFEDQSPFNLVASLVPLHKALLGKHVPKDTDGQWLFTRIELDRMPAEFSRLVLEIRGVLLSGALVKSKISVDGDDIGFLYFSWSAREHAGAR